jgi:hypothetical protein
MLIAIIVSVYLPLCLAIGFAGRKREFGFWGFFFFSLIVTPIVGLLTLIGGAPSVDDRERV